MGMTTYEIASRWTRRYLHYCPRLLQPLVRAAVWLFLHWREPWFGRADL